MDGAQASDRDSAVDANAMRQRVGGRAGGSEALVQTFVKLPVVQILVLVANIQMKTLKTEVEKGFT